MKDYEYYKKILMNNNIEFLNPNNSRISTQNKYNYKCSKGHIWSSRLSNLIYRSWNRESKGCPQCAKDITDQISKNAMEKNLLEKHKIISYKLKKVKSNGAKERFYQIECPYGHLYEKRTPSLKEGCPKCSIGVFVGEERVKIIFETYFGKNFKKIRPNWLVNPKTQSRLELDGYNKELKIAFEYQGRQHYSNNTQFASSYKEKFLRDEIKKELCKEHNVKLYILNQPPSYDIEKFTKSILYQLKEQGLIIPENINFSFKEINQDISLKKKYEEFKDLVEGYNIKLLSKTLSTMEDELEFQCEKNHLFKMNGVKFKEIINKNRTEHFCDKCTSKSGLKRSIFTIEDIKNFAKSIGFTLISNEYVSVNAPMQWKCHSGHILIKNYRQFQRNKTGNYCEECLKINPKLIVVNGVETRFKTKSGEVIDIDYVKDFANSIGFKLITTQYNNVNEKMHWICSNGHDVFKSYRQFQRNKTGKYCTECK